MSRDLIVVGIGSSAGGLKSLQEFFASLPNDIPATFVVVSHLPIDGQTSLHTILARFTSMQVELLKESTLTQPGKVYVLPGNLKLKIFKGMLLVRDRLFSEIRNTAIDEFFVSMANDQKENAIGIILSGTGTDGALGCELIHKQGGMVFVQNPDTAVHWGMPYAAISKDNPDVIMAPEQLATKLMHVIKLKQLNPTG
jgi:two-component system CheB/CheR fusion protein